MTCDFRDRPVDCLNEQNRLHRMARHPWSLLPCSECAVSRKNAELAHIPEGDSAFCKSPDCPNPLREDNKSGYCKQCFLEFHNAKKRGSKPKGSNHPWKQEQRAAKYKKKAHRIIQMRQATPKWREPWSESAPVESTGTPSS